MHLNDPLIIVTHGMHVFYRVFAPKIQNAQHVCLPSMILLNFQQEHNKLNIPHKCMGIFIKWMFIEFDAFKHTQHRSSWIQGDKYGNQNGDKIHKLFWGGGSSSNLIVVGGIHCYENENHNIFEFMTYRLKTLRHSHRLG